MSMHAFFFNVCRLPCANYPFLKKLKQSPEDINTQREVLNAVYQTAMVEGVGKQTSDHLLLLGKEGACEITCGLMKGRQEDRLVYYWTSTCSSSNSSSTRTSYYC